MNRMFTIGTAAFLTVLSTALWGGERQAVAVNCGAAVTTCVAEASGCCVATCLPRNCCPVPVCCKSESAPEEAPGKPRATIIEASNEQESAIAELKRLGVRLIGVEPSPGKPAIVAQFVRHSITDTEVQRLKKLTNLRRLDLGGTPVTDASLVHLKGFTNLQRLSLSITQVSDSGLEHLTGLTRLVELNLSHSKVSDSGLEHLKGMSNLELLYLHGTQVTDSGLIHLKGLANLQRLYLATTQVSDTGLEHLTGLNNLRRLHVNRTEVTDAGLEHLKELTGLERLDLRGTRVTDEGVGKLQKALPDCKIAR